MDNKELLEKVIEDRLTTTQLVDVKPEDEKRAFDEAMEAYDRKIEIEKLEHSKKNEKWNKILKGVELGVEVGIVGVTILSRWKYAKAICNFEKDYTFTSSAGRDLWKFVTSPFKRK